MELRNYKLYVHIAPNSKRYYGITGMNVKRRWMNGYGYKDNKYFQRAIKKYGWENFNHIILFDNLTKDEACLLEQCYIKLYNTNNINYGYNITTGGEHCKHSEESKKAMSINHLGKNAFKDKTEEEMNKINKKRSNSLKGKNNGSYGKVGVNAHKAKPYIIISTNGEITLKSRTELYNKGSRKGFFNITERIFKNYILELNGIFIDKMLPMMTNVNLKDKERILTELNKYNGWIVRVATKEEIDKYKK